ncbi:MAG: hypothetical protein ACRDRN_24695 [Sciscionella sp.]
MDTTVTIERPSYRTFAMLRAVAEGRAEISCGCEPDLFVDGLPCCDQCCAHDLARLGLVRPAGPGSYGQRVRAVLTDAGRRTLIAARPPITA